MGKIRTSTSQPIRRTESQTFYLEVSESTCSVSISVSLYESIDDGDDEDFLWNEGFYFHGPCEHDNPISLFYDIDGQNTEWEMSSVEDAYDHCWDFGYEWICLIGDDFREISSEGDGHDCDEQADGSWVCTRMMPPMLEAGEYDMTWEISEVEDGNNTIYWDLVHALQCTILIARGGRRSSPPHRDKRVRSPGQWRFPIRPVMWAYRRMSSRTMTRVITITSGITSTSTGPASGNSQSTCR